MQEGIKPNYINLLLTSVPTSIFIGIFLIFNEKILWFIFIPFGLLFLSFLSKPLEKCEFCDKPIKHHSKGLFDFHIQCDCIKDRWRPIWYLWCENLHKRIFNSK